MNTTLPIKNKLITQIEEIFTKQIKHIRIKNLFTLDVDF